MEAVAQLRARPLYYFSYLDHEILDERTLILPCDEETWLYKVDVEVTNVNGHQKRYHLGSAIQDQQLYQQPSYSGSVDCRTFTRRKHCALRPSLESVVESPLSNRSSLGLLSESKLLNQTFHLTPPQNSTSLEKNFLSSTDSEIKQIPRKFKLDSPFLNDTALGLKRNSINNCTFERTRLNSESSDIGLSLPQSLGSFDQGEQMTDSLVNFLAKENVSACPSTGPRNESPNSLVSLTDSLKIEEIGVDGKVEVMSGSLVSFLDSVNCTTPPSCQDNEMSSSVVDINEDDLLPTGDMTKSVINYLENGRNNLTKSIVNTSSTPESENIPPLSYTNGCNDRAKTIERDRIEDIGKFNSTYELEKNCDATFNLGNEEQVKETFTNSLNLTKKKKDNGEKDGDIKISKPFTNNLELSLAKENSEKSFKSKALNNRDLNVTQTLNDEDDLNSTMTLHYSRRNGTFTKGELEETLRSFRQISSKNSPLNNTFTKLVTQSVERLNGEEETLGSFKQISPKRSPLNNTFTKLVTQSVERLNGGLEDDQTSSASDSSFSSGSTKPRSVDELRSIAQQQETSLQQTSTPDNTNLGKLDFKLSPIANQETECNRKNETRSANCSPVRSSNLRSPFAHPISRLQCPSDDSKLRRQTLQASSMSNLARPRASGLRMPQLVSRFTVPSKTEPRPATAPTPAAPTGIPRPQASRLPMPRSRGVSNIGRPSTALRGLKRGGGRVSDYH